MKGKREASSSLGGGQAWFEKPRGRHLGRWITALCLAATAAGPMQAAAQQTNPPGMQYITEKAWEAPLPGSVIAVTPPAVIPQLLTEPDATGAIGSYQPNGQTVTQDNGFFNTSITSNKRSCFVCHRPDADWEITPQQVSAEYTATGGRSALFAPVDSAVCPDSPLLALPFISSIPPCLSHCTPCSLTAGISVLP